jgi:hypothetical protein
VLKLLSSNLEDRLEPEEAASERLVVDLALVTVRSGDRERCSEEMDLLWPWRGIILDVEKKL